MYILVCVVVTFQVASVSVIHSADRHGNDDSDHGSHCSDLPQQSLFFEDHTGEVGTCHATQDATYWDTVGASRTECIPEQWCIKLHNFYSGKNECRITTHWAQFPLKSAGCYDNNG